MEIICESLEHNRVNIRRELHTPGHCAGCSCFWAVTYQPTAERSQDIGRSCVLGRFGDRNRDLIRRRGRLTIGFGIAIGSVIGRSKRHPWVTQA